MKLVDKISRHFPKMEDMLKKADVSGFEYEERYFYFYGLGTWIRNNLLGEESELYREFCAHGIIGRDDQSYIILLLFYLYMKENK